MLKIKLPYDPLINFDINFSSVLQAVHTVHFTNTQCDTVTVYNYAVKLEVMAVILPGICTSLTIQRECQMKMKCENNMVYSL